MKDADKTKEQLIGELSELRKRISDVENSETQSRRDETLLRESEERYRAIFEQSGDCIYLADSATKKILQANQTCRRSIGYDADEITGLTLYDFVDHDRQDIDDKINHLLDGQKCFMGARRYRRKDGTLLDVEVTLCLISYAGIKTICAIARDITGRKRAEESLRLNESRLEALLRLNHMTSSSLKEVSDFALEEAIRLTGSRIGYFAFTNDDETVLTMYSWSRSALEECRIADKPLIYPMETTGLWGEAVRQRRPVITNDYTDPNPWKKGYPDGHVALIRHMNVPIFDGDHIVMVAGVGNKPTDYDMSDVRQLTLLMEGMWIIAQRKRTKEMLQSERDKAQKYLDIAGVILLAIDAEQKVTLINKKGIEILGYSEEDIIGRKWFDNFIPEQSRDVVRGAFTRILAGEIEPAEYFENLVLTKSREERIIAWHTTLLRDDSGNAIGTLSSGEDVTERRQSQKEMKLLASIVRHIPDAICSMDINGNVTSWNEGAVQMLGYKSEEILGKPFAMTVPPGMAQKELDHCIGILNAEGFFTGHESLRLTKDGRIVPVEITAVALRNEQDNITNYTSIMRNISKRRTAQEELRKRVKELEEFYDMAVGRELRMKELKDEMEELREEMERLRQKLDKYKMSKKS
jgi:PAS domain S-box-containing protein